MKELSQMLQRVFKSKVLRFVAVVAAMSCMMVGTAFAAAPAPVDYSDITEALTGSFGIAQIAAVIGIVLASGVTFVLFWWGSRKLVNGVINAFKSGKLKF